MTARGQPYIIETNLSSTILSPDEIILTEPSGRFITSPRMFSFCAILLTQLRNPTFWTFPETWISIVCILHKPQVISFPFPLATLWIGTTNHSHTRFRGEERTCHICFIVLNRDYRTIPLHNGECPPCGDQNFIMHRNHCHGQVASLNSLVLSFNSLSLDNGDISVSLLNAMCGDIQE